MTLKQLFRTKTISQMMAAERHDIKELYPEGHNLQRRLGVVDLTAFGIAAIVGAGIFSTIGNASANGGPAIVFLFILTAISCGLSALSYAQFSSLLPVAGSAYTYSYVIFGELIAWIIGWDLIMEYAIGNIAVAISWSEYFTALLKSAGIHVPEYLSMDFISAYRGFSAGDPQNAAYQAWSEAPRIFDIPLVVDLPALAIVLFVTYLAYIGIRETRNWCNGMVFVKLAAIALVIGLGVFYVDFENWTPFAPQGVRGVMSGVAAVFFAYIGFDAISTTAEECKNPQRDLPRSMMLSLFICTLIYIAVALVLTGVVPYSELAVADPLAFVFERLGMPWVSGFIAISAVVAMASVLLVFQVGMPRIWMSMSRDGLLPRKFSILHPKFHTPSFATVVTGVVVAVPALFLNLTEVTDLTSIGTLFAFALVNAGIVFMRPELSAKARFRIPHIDARYPLIALLLLLGVLLFVGAREELVSFLTFSSLGSNDITAIERLILQWFFVFSWIALLILSFQMSLSLLPTLGLLSCIYLMTELNMTNWIRFGLWLAVGLVIYFSYGFRHSKLAKTR